MRLLAVLCVLVLSLPLVGQDNTVDSLPHVRIGWAVDAAMGSVAKIDAYERMWMRNNSAQTFGAEVRFTPPATDDFARDYGLPVLGAGVRYGRYRDVTMRKETSPDWGMAEMVDYTSRMGDVVTAYAFFERPFWRSGRWEADYRFNIGLGWGANPYNKRSNVDNEITGSHLLIYFGFGLHATCFVRSDLGLRAGIEFAHHSNGALNRPNKGANFVGPMLGVVMRKGGAPKYIPSQPVTFKKKWYATLAVGLGGKTLLEEWLRTQYATEPDAPDYRKESFHVCYALSAQADLMYCYARRWSSGVGVDLFYASAARRIASFDRADGRQERHSPWSVGVAAKHEVWWHDLALTMSLGVYLYRQMGFTARDEEKPYYERIGLKYVFPRLHGLFVGVNVKAHLTKADQTEFIVGMRL